MNKSKSVPLSQLIKYVSKEAWIIEFNKNYPEKAHFAEQVYQNLLDQYENQPKSFSTKFINLVNSKLDQPHKRKAFLVGLLGVLIMFISIIFQPESASDFLYAAFTNPSLTITPNNFEEFLFTVNVFSSVFWLGLLVSLLGFIYAFLYDQTFSKLNNWINKPN